MRRIRAGGGGAGVTGSGGGGGGGTSAGSSDGRAARPGGTDAARAPRPPRPGDPAAVAAAGNGSPRRRLQEAARRPPPARTLLPLGESPPPGSPARPPGRGGGGCCPAAPRGTGPGVDERSGPPSHPGSALGAAGGAPGGGGPGARRACPTRGCEGAAGEPGRGLRLQTSGKGPQSSPAGQGSPPPSSTQEGSGHRLGDLAPRGCTAPPSRLGCKMWRPQGGGMKWPIQRHHGDPGQAWPPNKPWKVFRTRRGLPSTTPLPAFIHSSLTQTFTKVNPSAQ